MRSERLGHSKSRTWYRKFLQRFCGSQPLPIVVPSQESIFDGICTDCGKGGEWFLNGSRIWNISRVVVE